ncbi:MAG: hypothetical protein AB8B57_15390 [Congregibacter sp.]
MIYVLILGVVVLAAAPLWHFAPSKRQRHQAKLRETAALSGLFVEFRDWPLPPARLERLHTAERQLLYYGCRLPHLRGEVLNTVSWYRDADGWASLPPRQALPELVEQLPDSVLALGLSHSSCGLFWQERGDAEQVAEFARLLGLWRDSIVDQRR